MGKLNNHRYLLFWLFLPLSGCVWKTYDKEKPHEYTQFWQNEQNKKNSILYQFTEEGKEQQIGRKR